MKERLPVSLLTGFLGSGKTTLLNRLLRHPDLQQTAIIVNEFGDIGLDHWLIEKGSEDTILLDNGCLCCSVLGDLVQTMRSLLLRREEGSVISFQRLLIETTGLADPAPLIHTLMNDPMLRDYLRLDGIIATIDAVHGMGQLDQHMESVKQIAMADRIVLTKTDLEQGPKLRELQSRLRRLNPSAPIVTAANLDPADLINAGLYNPKTKSFDVQQWLREEAHSQHHLHGEAHDHAGHARDASCDYPRSGGHPESHRHDERIAAFHLTLEEPVIWEEFVNWAEMLTTLHGEQLLRLKGIVQVKGEERPLVLHAVQHLFHPPVQLPAWPDDKKQSRLVFITRDFGKDAVQQSLKVFNLN